MPAVIQPHCITDPLTQSNCYILTAESHALIIDPNCYQEIHSYLANHQLVPEYIILTHEHCDHIAALNDMRKNYDLKVNKKQKKLALEFALNEKAANNALFVVDSLSVESGKTKDAAKIIKTLGTRDALIVKELVDEKTLLAFRNIQNCYLVEANELNAYLATAFYAVIIEKSVLETITKEG